MSGGKMKQGYTLLEVLLTIAIIVVVSALIIFVAPRQQMKARDAKRREDIRLIQSRIEEYRIDLGVYPTAVAFGESLVSPDGSTSYLSLVPQDPLAREAQLYTYFATPAASPTTYTLCAYRLEVDNSPYCMNNLQ